MAHTVRDFKLGQRVKVRTVEDMVAEYGYKRSRPNEIDCPGVVFNVEEMATFCGMTAEFQKAKYDSYVQCWEMILEDWLDLDGNPTSEVEQTGRHWFWTSYMLEPAEEVLPRVNFTLDLFNQMIGVAGQ